MTVSISDIVGRVWMEKSFPISMGANIKEQLDTDVLPRNMYWVKISQGTKTTFFKVIKN
jgi:hypothetical protein